MSGSQPLVSIGVPVYNGERFLAAALGSLLDQTFTDFEIVICDNASTDTTAEICQRFAVTDGRVRYFRNARNIGAAANFNRTFELSGGEYFKWAAADDLIAREFLRECVDALEADSRVVLSHPETIVIDSDDQPVEVHGHYRNLLVGADAPAAPERFRSLVLSQHYCFDVFGLIRRSLLARTPLIGSYIASDRNLLAELGLLGRFHRVPRPLFFSREHEGRSIRAMPTLSSRARWFDPEARGRQRPQWRQLGEYARSVARVELPLSDRMACMVTLARLLRWRWSSFRAELPLVRDRSHG